MLAVFLVNCDFLSTPHTNFTCSMRASVHVHIVSPKSKEAGGWGAMRPNKRYLISVPRNLYELPTRVAIVCVCVFALRLRWQLSIVYGLRFALTKKNVEKNTHTGIDSKQFCFVCI